MEAPLGGAHFAEVAEEVSVVLGPEVHYPEEKLLTQLFSIKIKAVTSCSTHKIDQQETDG